MPTRPLPPRTNSRARLSAVPRLHRGTFDRAIEHDGVIVSGCPAMMPGSCCRGGPRARRAAGSSHCAASDDECVKPGESARTRTRRARRARVRRRQCLQHACTSASTRVTLIAGTTRPTNSSASATLDVAVTRAARQSRIHGPSLRMFGVRIRPRPRVCKWSHHSARTNESPRYRGKIG